VPTVWRAAVRPPASEFSRILPKFQYIEAYMQDAGRGTVVILFLNRRSAICTPVPDVSGNTARGRNRTETHEHVSVNTSSGGHSFYITMTRTDQS
jgi:hypothetical protein